MTDLLDCIGDTTSSQAREDFQREDSYQAAVMELKAQKLQQIHKAFTELAEQSYGRFECCSKRIPAARLRLVPYATTCVPCPSEIEADEELTVDHERREVPIERVGRDVPFSPFAFVQHCRPRPPWLWRNMPTHIYDTPSIKRIP